MRPPGAPSPDGEATRLLAAVAAGADAATGTAQGAAKAELFALVYDELRRIAGGLMHHQRAAHTLQTTALVNEAYLRLVGGEGGSWNDRAHFVRVAASAMRSILVDHARARGAAKRGGSAVRQPLDIVLDDLSERVPDFLGLDEALQRLAAEDEQLAQLVELRFFVGLTNDETAEVLGLSRPTVERRWRVARAWLRRELGETP